MTGDDLSEMQIEQTKENRYKRLAAWVFEKPYIPGAKRVPWVRDELVEAAAALAIDLPKNLGDVLYAIRYRTSLPEVMIEAAPEGMEWVIRSKYPST
ncbi:hypothetical protein [Rathayibacter toxicus]|uniref:hypothetical protein n=1 Tax=Rathayibacter toxicus TaxID=145458 RepID=UPI001C047B04|nr:hypothetical protein [Rathayibacter toxicus]